MAKGFGKDSGDNPKLKDDKITPIGNYPLTYRDNIYGMPGYHLEGSNPKDANGIVALHYMYDPKHRGKLFNNNNDEDNYRSFGCVNNTKETQQKLVDLNLANKKVTVFNSKLSPAENIKYAKANEFINTLPADKQVHTIDSFNHLYYPTLEKPLKNPNQSINAIPDSNLLNQAIKDGYSKYDAEQMIKQGFKRNPDGTWRDYEYGGQIKKFDNGGSSDNTRTQRPFIPESRSPQREQFMRQAPDNMTLAHQVGKQREFDNNWDYVNNNYIKPLQMVNDKVMDAESIVAAPELLANLGKGAIKKLAKSYWGKPAESLGKGAIQGVKSYGVPDNTDIPFKGPITAPKSSKDMTPYLNGSLDKPPYNKEEDIWNGLFRNGKPPEIKKQGGKMKSNWLSNY
jgi:hypothetical protein